MPQDLRLFADRVTRNDWPHVTCPVCLVGYVALDAISEFETMESQGWRADDNWEPDYIEGHFTGTLSCALPSCREVVVVCGTYEVDYVRGPDGGWYGEVDSFYRLKYTSPALPLLAFPDGTPDDVRASAIQAGALVWVDPGAAANRLRTSIENLLTAKKVARFSIDKKKHRRNRLPTHSRIERFEKAYPDAAEALMAVKWLGNDGSHESGGLTSIDVIDGADLLQHALKLIYDDEAKSLMQRARQINASKGLPRKSR